MDKELTALKLVLIAWPKNTPKCPRIYLPNLSAQAQKFWISMSSLGKINTHGNSKHQDPGYHFGPASQTALPI